MVTKKDRERIFNEAPPLIAEAYSSLDTAQRIAGLKEKYSITHRGFVDVIGDAILGLFPRSAIASELVKQTGLAQLVAEDVARSLESFFAALPVYTPSRGIPAPEPDSQPLTREDLMRALEQRQTRPNHVDAMKQKLSEAAEKKVVGYESIPERNIPHYE